MSASSGFHEPFGSQLSARDHQCRAIPLKLRSQHGALIVDTSREFLRSLRILRYCPKSLTIDAAEAILAS